MIKLLGKIVVILLAALMVAGATLALDNSGALSSLTGGDSERGHLPEGSPADSDSAFAAGERPERGGSEFGGGEGGRGGWASSLQSLVRNLGLIAAVVGGVWLLGWLARQATTRRKLAKAEMLPSKEEIILEEKL